MYGLSDKLLKEFKIIKEKYDLKMCIFGSRANGKYKYNSDIDICIMNKDISEELIHKIMNDFDLVNTVYKIDLVFLKNIKNNKFLSSIKEEGIEI